MYVVLLALLACWSSGFRPESARLEVSAQIHKIGDLMSMLSRPQDRLVALKQANRVVNSILAQERESGPADAHFSPEDEGQLRAVLDLIATSVYGSMDAAHQADIEQLNGAIAAHTQCSTDIQFRQSAKGDLGRLRAAVQDKQTELNRLAGVVDEKTQENASQWAAFDVHMQQIADPPSCPALPARTQQALDLYFEKSLYSIWYSAQQASYNSIRAAFVEADSALQAAIEAYNVQLAVRDVQYCDWKQELEAACHAYTTCVTQASSHYLEELKPRVQADESVRVDVFKAGETLLHQIKFLLGDVDSQETPEIDTKRYEIDYPALPGQVNCDRDVLTSPEWQPPVVCYEQEFRLLGRGACRTPSGGTGTHTILREVSLTTCQEECLADRSCLAIEYKEAWDHCEIHTAFVDRVQSTRAICLVKIMPFALVGEGSCRTPSGEEGTPASQDHVPSEADCMTLCRDDDSCLTVEYSSATKTCELHTEPMVVTQPEPGVICLSKES